jgi:hypothetical protein
MRSACSKELSIRGLHERLKKIGDKRTCGYNERSLTTGDHWWRARFSCRNTDWRTAPGRIPTACRSGRGGVDAALLQAMKATSRNSRCWNKPATWVMRPRVLAFRCSGLRIRFVSRSRGRGNALWYLPTHVNATTGQPAMEILNSTGYRPRGSSLTRILVFRRWPHATSSHTCFEAIPAALRRVKRRD